MTSVKMNCMIPAARRLFPQWLFFSALCLALPALADEGYNGQASTPLPLAQSDAVVTYSGLRTYEDGSSTLRVNLSRQVPVSVEQKGTKIVFLLKGAKVELKNNRNPLRAEYFNSNVLRTQMRDSKQGVLVEIEVRKPVTPVHNLLKHSGGTILRIDIPQAK